MEGVRVFNVDFLITSRFGVAAQIDQVGSFLVAKLALPHNFGPVWVNGDLGKFLEKTLKNLEFAVRVSVLGRWLRANWTEVSPFRLENIFLSPAALLVDCFFEAVLAHIAATAKAVHLLL
jgi:hypothetical protein